MENLFFSNHKRKQSMIEDKQLQSIEDLIKIYACYFTGCQFVFKVNNRVAYKNDPKASRTKNLQLAFRELSSLTLESTEKEIEGAMKFSLTHTKANDSVSSKTIITFVNNRLVKSEELQRSISNAFREAAMAINKSKLGYFILASLLVNPKWLDFNMSANKLTFCILQQKDLFRAIELALLETLRESSNVKQYTSQVVQFNYFNSQHKKDDRLSETKRDKFMIRSDPKAVTLDLMFKRLLIRKR